MNSSYLYPTEAFEDVYRWVHEIGRGTPTEINLLLYREESMSSGTDYHPERDCLCRQRGRGPLCPFPLRNLSGTSAQLRHPAQRADDDGPTQRLRHRVPLHSDQAIHCRQHLDPRTIRGPAAGSEGDRANPPASPLTHGVDELGLCPCAATAGDGVLGRGRFLLCHLCRVG